MTFAIACDQVAKRYGEFEALKGASIEVKTGECFGLLGPNGAGKSTLIKILYGATPRNQGHVSVLGFDPAHESIPLKERVGVVTQDNALDESMNVIENLEMYARFKSVPQPNRKSHIEGLLDFMALTAKAKVPIRALSGGMQRRLVFARALVGDPELVILDEPTTGLDPAVRHVLWNKITDLRKKGRTILLTTHYMDEAERLCDRLVIMDQGLIKAEGSPSKLIQKHCPGYVANYFVDPNAEARAKEIATANTSFQLVEEATGFQLIHQNLDELIQATKLIPVQPSMIRPSNLEDVFLNITGRELTGNA